MATVQHAYGGRHVKVVLYFGDRILRTVVIWVYITIALVTVTIFLVALRLVSDERSKACHILLLRIARQQKRRVVCCGLHVPPMQRLQVLCQIIQAICLKKFSNNVIFRRLLKR